MKSDYIERRFRMNRQTTVTIRSKMDEKSDIYKNTVIVTREESSLEPLKTHTRAEIEEMIKEIDLEDDQTTLAVGGE